MTGLRTISGALIGPFTTRTNFAKYPSFEKVGAGTVYLTNLLVNPGLEGGTWPSNDSSKTSNTIER